MLTISINNDNIEKFDKWLKDLSEDIRITQSVSEHKYITDWDSDICYVEKCVRENPTYRIIQNEFEYKYACVIPNYFHKMTFEINKFTFEIINKIIELRDLEIEYELYDCDKNKVEYQDLYDWKEDLLSDLITIPNVSTYVVKYCDSFVFGIFLIIFALIFCAFA